MSVYALKGMVRYEDVEGDGYLQLDSHFGDAGTFFSKSLAPSGPLGKLSGSSDWRPFVLPFHANSGDEANGTMVPKKLTLSVFLPGSGTVSISDVGLYQYADGENPMGSNGQWLDNRSASWLGAIAGSVIGLWSAFIGMLGARGKARKLVIGSTHVLYVLGIVGLAGGVVAIALGQTYAVFFPLSLIGVLLFTIAGRMRGTVAAHYEQLELQRMRSMDA